jgi:hypothetical protein
MGNKSVVILLIRLTNGLFAHKAPPMDALKYQNIFIIQHIFFAFLANVSMHLNNLAIKIWAGLFLLDNPL